MSLPMGKRESRHGIRLVSEKTAGYLAGYRELALETSSATSVKSIELRHDFASGLSRV
jgi:hypothetical protein